VNIEAYRHNRYNRTSLFIRSETYSRLQRQDGKAVNVQQAAGNQAFLDIPLARFGWVSEGV
jgi:hypothetical protein